MTDYEPQGEKRRGQNPPESYRRGVQTRRANMAERAARVQALGELARHHVHVDSTLHRWRSGYIGSDEWRYVHIECAGFIAERQAEVARLTAQLAEARECTTPDGRWHRRADGVWEPGS